MLLRKDLFHFEKYSVVHKNNLTLTEATCNLKSQSRVYLYKKYKNKINTFCNYIFMYTHTKYFKES